MSPLEIDRVARTIRGRAVPLGVVAQPKMALPRRFPRGTLTWGNVRLLIDHNNSLRVGRAIQITEDDDGLWTTFKVFSNPRGDRALELAATTRHGLSVGVDPGSAVFHVTHDGIEECVAALLVEVSLTRDPVFP